MQIAAEFAARQVGEITSRIRDEEAVLVLQDQLREVGGHAGRDDVVRIAAGSRPFRMLDHRGFTRRARARGVAGSVTVAPAVSATRGIMRVRYKALLARLGVSDLADGSGLIKHVRRVKSPREIAYIRQAGRYCEASLRAAVEAARPGATENDVAAAAYQVMYAAGGEFLGHEAQYVAGPAAGLGFECDRRRPIRRDDVIYMEAGGTHHRYNLLKRVFALDVLPGPKRGGRRRIVGVHPGGRGSTSCSSGSGWRGGRRSGRHGLRRNRWPA